MKGVASNMPYEQPQVFKKRIEGLRYLTLLALIILLFGFWKTQILSYLHFSQLAEANRTSREVLYPARGLILDRYGRILADTRFIPLLVWQPRRHVSPRHEFQRLVQQLQLDARIRDAWLKRAARLSPIYPEPLNFPLELSQIARLSFFQEWFPDLAIQNRPIRIYPYGKVVAHLVGYVGWMSEADQKRFDRSSRWPPNSFIGKVGLERMYEYVLHGQPGMTEFIVNHLGIRLRELVSERLKPVQGNTLQLSLDIDLQKAAYDALAGHAAAFVALDPRSGAIRALVSRPSFDPNEFIPFISNEVWQRLVKNPKHPLQNRATQGLYSPGSTIKPILAAIALFEGWITPQKQVYCPGYARLYNHTFQCWQPGGHGAVNLHEALVHSCDVYFYQLGAHHDIDTIGDRFRRFGLGQPLLVDYSPVAEGLVPSRAWKQRVRGEPWFPGETVSVAIGQGPLLVTPLQLAVAYSMVYNEGYRYRPFLVSMIRTPDGTNRIIRRPVLEEEYFPDHPGWRLIKEALCDVVKEGTGRRAASSRINICGKTGTVELISEPEKLEESVLQKFTYHAWFAGWTEIQGEPMVFALIVEHSGHGGEVAAPLVRTILESYLVRRGKPVRPATKAKGWTDENRKEGPT